MCKVFPAPPARLSSPLLGSVKLGLSTTLKMYPNLGGRRKLWEPTGQSKSPTSFSMAPPSCTKEAFVRRATAGVTARVPGGVSMRMKEIQVVLGGGWCPCPPPGLCWCCLPSPRHRHACWVMGWLPATLLSPLLSWSNLLPLQVSKRIREARPQSPEPRALPEVSPSKQPPLSPPCPLGLLPLRGPSPLQGRDAATCPSGL